jgi:hypothetical protein
MSAEHIFTCLSLGCRMHSVSCFICLVLLRVLYHLPWCLLPVDVCWIAELCPCCYKWYCIDKMSAHSSFFSPSGMIFFRVNSQEWLVKELWHSIALNHGFTNYTASVRVLVSLLVSMCWTVWLTSSHITLTSILQNQHYYFQFSVEEPNISVPKG